MKWKVGLGDKRGRKMLPSYVWVAEIGKKLGPFFERDGVTYVKNVQVKSFPFDFSDNMT